MRRVMTLLVATTTLIVAAGCGREAPETEAGARYLTIKGSDTMVHLVSGWAEEFIAHNPGTEVSVTGGGSGTGIAALINGTTDIAAASREMKPGERELARARGVEPVETAAARDGIAVVVHPGNPVDTLTMEQIRKIYTGAVTNWRQLGGPDRAIVVLSRESSSGTYVFFQEHVLAREDYTPRARLMPATSSIIQSVADDRWAIGYVGLGYAAEAEGRVEPVAVKADRAAEAVLPSVETVNSGAYSIARPLFLYTNGAPAGLAGRFVEFALGPDGQRIVRESGYVPVER